VFMKYDPDFVGQYKPGQAALDDVPVMEYDDAANMVRKQAAEDQLLDFFRVKGADMDLAMKKRKAPGDTEGVGYVDRDFKTPAPSGAMEDLSLKYPRNPDPSAPLPLNDRGRFLVEGRADLAKFIADKVRKSGQLGADTQKFYHSDGPLCRAAVKPG